MSEIFGESPRPWTLVIGPPSGESEEQLSTGLPGTVKFTQVEDIGAVRQDDFDAAVVFGAAPSLARHLMVLQVGGVGTGEILSDRPNTFPYRYDVTIEGHSVLFEIEHDNIPDEISHGDRRGLAEHLVSQQPHGLIYRAHGALQSVEGIHVLMREKRGLPCAGWWHRGKNSPAQWWWLPEHTPNLKAWALAIFSRWRGVSPERFPAPLADWSSSPEWMTATEIDAHAALEDHKKETARILRERNEEEGALTLATQSAREAADDSERRLITAQGKSLVEAVSAALGSFGLTVVDSDGEKTAGAFLLEDLRVSYGDWTSLVEVRGYIKGAKTGDFQRIERAVRHYERLNRISPNARWYVVNHNFGTPPGARPLVLSGADDDIAVFSEENGLVIDTRVLFKMCKMIGAGELSAVEARKILMESTGRLSLNP